MSVLSPPIFPSRLRRRSFNPETIPSVASCVVSRRPGAGNRGRGQGDQRSIESLRDLIRQTSKENPRWGASRIHGELLMLGFEVAQSTASVGNLFHCDRANGRTGRT